RLEDIELINEEIIVSFDFSIDNYLKKREWKIEKEIDDNDRFALTRQQIKDELWGREEPVLISSKFRYQKSFVGKI
ncbi:MAG: hypothetical protein U9Q06_04795, partial [Nanoarchaeota archaeon]|nr:hypothetical protein [Nanoarchaeota archaeon]